MDQTAQPESAVCNSCGWEGTEDDVPVERSADGDGQDYCPKCKNADVNYFYQPSCGEPADDGGQWFCSRPTCHEGEHAPFAIAPGD